MRYSKELVIKFRTVLILILEEIFCKHWHINLLEMFLGIVLHYVLKLLPIFQLLQLTFSFVAQTWFNQIFILIYVFIVFFSRSVISAWRGSKNPIRVSIWLKKWSRNIIEHRKFWWARNIIPQRLTFGRSVVYSANC